MYVYCSDEANTDMENGRAFQFRTSTVFQAKYTDTSKSATIKPNLELFPTDVQFEQLLGIVAE